VKNAPAYHKRASTTHLFSFIVCFIDDDDNYASKRICFRHQIRSLGWCNDYLSTRHFVNLTFFQLDILSTWHLSTWHCVNLTFCQPDILSTWHFVNLTFCQPDILSTWHFVKMKLCQLDIMSTLFLVNLLYCKLDCFQHDIFSKCFFVYWSLYRNITLSIILSLCNYINLPFINMPFCQLTISSICCFFNYIENLTFFKWSFCKNAFFVNWPFHRRVIFSFHQLPILSFIHFINLQFYHITILSLFH
jgi:hypothetical protein